MGCGGGRAKRLDVLRPSSVACRAQALLLLLVCLGLLFQSSLASNASAEEPRRFRRQQALRVPEAESSASERRLVDDSSCLQSQVQGAGLQGVYAFSDGTTGLGICSSPWHCGIDPATNAVYGGNFFQVHAAGQGDTWSPPLESTQTSASSCDNVADWKVAADTNSGIEYRTCKVTSPATMWFAMFVSAEGTIDGLRFADAFPRTSDSEFGWLPQTPSSDRRRFSFTSAAALGNMDSTNRRRRSFAAAGEARGLFQRTTFTGNSQASDPFPSVNHLIVVPDLNGDWIQEVATEERVITETAPVEMLLAITWTGTDNFHYTDTAIQTILDAVTADWCFWSPCAVPAVSNAAQPGCLEGTSIRHGTSCTPRCAANYNPSVPSLACSQGVLSPATFTCVGVPCTAPTGIANAASPPCQAGTDIAHGGVCEARCATGYTPSVSTLNCDLGVLTPSTFTCGGSSCFAPVGLASSLAPACMEGDVIPHGGTCTPRCITDYLPTVQSLSCDYGVLLPLTLFQCFGRTCEVPTGIENAASPLCAEGSLPIEHTGKCTTQCLMGYKPTNQFLACDLGILSPKDFRCDPAPCLQPYGIPNSATTCVNDGKTCWESTCEEGIELQHGVNCTTRCSAGYYGDPVTLSCQFGEMQPPRYNCLESGCLVPTWINNSLQPPCDEGFFIASGDNCTTRCHEGYYVSEPQMRCLRGKLSPDYFSCLGSPCPAPDRAMYTRGMTCDRCSTFKAADTCYNGDLIEHGDRCVARCDPGYTPTAFSLDCRLGKLSPPEFGCTEVVDGFDHDSQLLDACRVSDEFRIDRLVAMRANLAFRSSGGDTALHLCTLHGQKDVIRRLLLANAATNAPDSRKWTPLHVAASRGHAASVSELLAHGGDVLARNDAGATPGDLARRLAGAADPHLGKLLTGQQEAALVLMQAERLRANQDCAQDQICPAPLPGGWRADSPSKPEVQIQPVLDVDDENIATADTNSTAVQNVTNVSNITESAD